MLRLMCLLKGSVSCLNSHLDRANTMIDQSLSTCPHCGAAKLERMPTDACQFFYDCTGCGARLKPKPGDCCVFVRTARSPVHPSRRNVLLAIARPIAAEGRASVSYTHLRAHETRHDLVCRLLLEKKK